MSEVSQRNVNSDISQDNPQNNDVVINQNSACKIILEQISENRLELFHQLTRVLSLTFSFFCFLSAVKPDGSWNSRSTYFTKAMLSGATSHSLTMHVLSDSIPPGGLLSMDQFQYLIYCYILSTSQPSLVALFPLCIWTLLDLVDYFHSLLTMKIAADHHFMQVLSWIRANKDALLQTVAYFEIFIGVVIVPWVFLMDINIIVFGYYKFLQLRYVSQSDYSRHAFSRCRQILESISQQRQCPIFVRDVIIKIVRNVSQLCPLASDEADHRRQGDLD